MTDIKQERRTNYPITLLLFYFSEKDCGFLIYAKFFTLGGSVFNHFFRIICNKAIKQSREMIQLISVEISSAVSVE